MNVLGLDLSLTATGLAIDLGPSVAAPPKGKDRGVDRLGWFYDYISSFVYAHEINVVLIEGYSYASKFGREALGELGGVVRLALANSAVRFTTVQPKTVKKYATGKGNANKDAMLSAAIQRSGLPIDDNNAADAWWLYQIGLTKYAPERAVKMPAENTKALEQIEWP